MLHGSGDLMIQEFEAAALFQKFGGMKGYDFLAPAGVDERVKALMICDDAKHAENVASKLQMLPMCPTVANIRREIADSRRSVAVCGVCEDTGVEWIDSTAKDGSGLKCETWRPCKCSCEWAVSLRRSHQRDLEWEAKKQKRNGER
jgi:hypothetical protein